jgi:hypothetical protein
VVTFRRENLCEIKNDLGNVVAEEGSAKFGSTARRGKRGIRRSGRIF